MPLLAILATVFGLGAFWVFVIPMLQGYIPASFTANKWLSLAVTGTMLFATVVVVSFVLRKVKLKPSALKV